MFLQRLIADEEVGFNYDYMGSVEYENGATRNGRMALANLFVDGKMCARKIKMCEKIGKMKHDPIEVLAIGSTETLDALGNPAVISVTKEAFHLHQAKYIGWMHVGHSEKVEPLLFVRCDMPGDEISDRVNKFLKGPIDYIKENQVT